MISSVQALASDLADLSFGAGWDKPEPSMWPEPRREFRPFHWRYADARRVLDSAGSSVRLDQAERRNLICVNPKPGNNYATTPTLVAAYQMVMPGESPRPHHHTPSALRIVLDVTEPTYTVVDGVQVGMSPGDVLLTPSWMWHSHGNASSAAGYWVDVLDVPLVHSLRTMFFERHPDARQRIDAVARESVLRYSVPALSESAPEAGPGLRCQAFANDQLHAIGLTAVRLAAGSSWFRPRSTLNTLYVVLSGEVTVELLDRTEENSATADRFLAGRGDVVAVPLWWRHRLSSEPGSVLVRVTDEPLIRYLDLYREERPA